MISDLLSSEDEGDRIALERIKLNFAVLYSLFFTFFASDSVRCGTKIFI